MTVDPILVVWLPAVLAVITAGAAARRVWSLRWRRMGLPAWTFSSSWASNISVVGGLVSTTMLGNLPAGAGTLLPKPTYYVLEAVFPLFAALAPLVYNFSREVRATGAPANQITATGNALMFLVSGAMTLYGALGQIGLQALVLADLGRAGGIIPGSVVLFLDSVFLGVVAGLVYYAYKTMVLTVCIQPAAPPLAFGAARAFGQTHALRWPLL